jgi:hypothetical protein
MLDTIKSYVTRGTVASVLAVVALIAGFLGRDELGAYLNAPETADLILSVLTGVLAIVAGVSQGVKKPDAE